MRQIVIKGSHRMPEGALLALNQMFDLSHMAALTDAARRPPALSDPSPLITAGQETWTTTAGAATFTSATAAHQFARYNGTVAVAAEDAKAPVSLAGVL
jgi:hypothetical protein